MFADRMFDVADFAKDFDRKKLADYVPYYDGSEFLDVYQVIDKTEIDKLIRKLSLDTHNKLEQYARENGWDENEMDLSGNTGFFIPKHDDDDANLQVKADRKEKTLCCLHFRA